MLSSTMKLASIQLSVSKLVTQRWPVTLLMDRPKSTIWTRIIKSRIMSNRRILDPEIQIWTMSKSQPRSRPSSKSSSISAAKKRKSSNKRCPRQYLRRRPLSWFPSFSYIAFSHFTDELYSGKRQGFQKSVREPVMKNMPSLLRVLSFHISRP